MGIKVRRVVILCFNPLEIYMSFNFKGISKRPIEHCFHMEIIIYPLNIPLFRKISNIAGKKYQ